MLINRPCRRPPKPRIELRNRLTNKAWRCLWHRRPIPGRSRCTWSSPGRLAAWLERQDAPTRAWVGAMRLRSAAPARAALPARTRRQPARARWSAGARRRRAGATASRSPPPPRSCPPAPTRSAEIGAGLDPGLEALGWLLADYRFDRYRKGKAAAAPSWSVRTASMPRGSSASPAARR